MPLVDKAWYVKDGTSIGWSAVTPWAALTAVAAGVVRRQLATPTEGNERCFVCIVAGTTGAAEPTWVVTRGAKTTDGTVTWQESTGQASLCGDATNTTSSASMRSIAVVLGQIVKNVAGTHLFICSTAGTAGASEPTYVTTTGATTTDSGATWTCIGAVGDFAAWASPAARVRNAALSTWAMANNIIYVSHNHVETQSTSNNMGSGVYNNASNVLKIICVDDGAALPVSAPYLSPSAQIIHTGTADISLAQNTYYEGLILISSGRLNTRGVCKNCVFKLTGTSNYYSNSVNYEGFLFIDCETIFGATTQASCVGSNFREAVHYREKIGKTGSVTTLGFRPGPDNNSRQSIRQIYRDTDLSSITGTIIETAGMYGGYIRFENCKLANGVTLVNSNWSNVNGCEQDTRVGFYNCDSADTNYRFYEATPFGTIQQDTSRVKTGGASDGTTAISLLYTTNTYSSRLTPLYTDYFVSRWLEDVGSEITLSIDFVCASQLTSNDIWIEVEYSADDSTPLGTFSTTMISNILSTSGTDIASSDAVWSGSALVAQKLQVTFTPANKGVVVAKVCLSKPSTTIYIDPKIEIS